MRKDFDYIITGAGCAGLSLLVRMLQEEKLRSKRILLVDKSPKTANDRTWCFWEQQPGFFEPIVHHRWNELHFFSTQLQKSMDIAPYQYKMIRAIDFYEFCFEIIRQHPNVTVLYDTVDSIGNDGHLAFVQLGEQKFSAPLLFNSILFGPIQPRNNEFYLLQHFKGWVIETAQPCFDSNAATLMDFRVSQEHGTTFVYVMPTSSKQALVEYTLFTPALLDASAYDAALQQYIQQYLQITDYTVQHEEFGIIPMTNHRFPTAVGNIINIGTAGGNVKASSGYAFQHIQKKTSAIVQALVAGASPHHAGTTARKFRYYDSVLLNVLTHHPQQGAAIFSNIFANNQPQTIFRFLDNESRLQDDLKIIRPLTSSAFIKAGIQEASRFG